MDTSITKKSLNINNIQKKLEKLGLSQTALSKKIGVSKEAISKWLKNEKFPRPRHLLQLAETLDLTFDEIVIKSRPEYEPIIAFRKKGRHKIDDDYIRHAKHKGTLLDGLADYVPFKIESPPSYFINPQLNYDYIQRAAEYVRSKINKSAKKKIEFTDLIALFIEKQAIIIPVMWGNKDKHENALHINLPSSNTTWIYLNLECNTIDFKFWMAHELGHMFTPKLTGNNDGEDFADDFAGALLFPECLAKIEYETLTQIEDIGSKINYIKRLANNYIISPVTIYYEINKYAKYSNKTPLDLGSKDAIHKATTNFHKGFNRVYDYLFELKSPSPNLFINQAKQTFSTPFFDVLKKYIHDKSSSPALIQHLLDMSYLDAKSLFEELIH